jgi:hypothetical protein
MIYTNEDVIKIGVNAGELRKFRLIATDGGFAWVEAINGLYKGERLTFKHCDIKKCITHLDKLTPIPTKSPSGTTNL